MRAAMLHGVALGARQPALATCSHLWCRNCPFVFLCKTCFLYLGVQLFCIFLLSPCYISHSLSCPIACRLLCSSAPQTQQDAGFCLEPVVAGGSPCKLSNPLVSLTSADTILRCPRRLYAGKATLESANGVVLVERSCGNPGATSKQHHGGGIEARAQQHESDASSSAAHVEHRSRLQAEAESY